MAESLPARRRASVIRSPVHVVAEPGPETDDLPEEPAAGALDVTSLPTIKRLLDEFTQKLRGLTEQADRFRDRHPRVTLIWQMGKALLSIGLFWLLFQLFGRPYARDYLGQIPAPLLFAGLWLVLAATFVVTTRALIRREKSVLQRDISATSSHLTGLVKRASQLHEHMKMPYDERLELDLRLADAEDILAHAAALDRGLK